MSLAKFTLRPASEADGIGLADPIIGCGLFAPDEAEGFIEMVPDLLADPGNHWHVLIQHDVIVGAAYMSLEPLSEDVWNLWFIGLTGASQGRGGGQMLLSASEDAARNAGGRLMLIDTSSGPDFGAAHRFYQAAGYEAEARIRAYYGPGEDKITYRKNL